MSLIGKWICAFSSKKFAFRDEWTEWTITLNVEWLRYWKATELESIKRALLPYRFSNNDIVLPALQHDACNDEVSIDKFFFFFNFSWKFRVNIFLFTHSTRRRFVFFLWKNLKKREKWWSLNCWWNCFSSFSHIRKLLSPRRERVEIYDDLLRFWNSSYESRLKEKPLNEIFCVFYFLWKLWMRQRRRRLAREINKGSKGVCKQTSHGKTFIWGKQTHTLHPAAAAAMSTSEKWKKIFVKKIITCSQHMHFNSYSFHFVTKNIYIIKRSWNESDIFTVNFTYTELTTRWGE